MKNVGKKFEEDFFKSVPINYFAHRIKDGSSRTDKQGNIIRLKTNNLCDFIMYSGYNLYLLELKSVKEKSMSFNNIDSDIKKQKIKLEKLFNESLKQNTEAGLVINFRSIEKTYFVTIKDFLKFYNCTEKKSINVNDVICIGGKLIPQTIKRVRYNYNLNIFK